MIPKRIAWFGIGMVTGAAGTVYAYVRAREAASIEPAKVADTLVGAGRNVSRRVGTGVRDVVTESRAAVREVEDEMRSTAASGRRGSK